MDSVNVGEVVLPTLLIETNYDISNSDTHIDLGHEPRVDEPTLDFQCDIEWLPNLFEEAPYPNIAQIHPPETACPTFGSPDIQSRSIPSHFFIQNNVEFLADIPNQPVNDFLLNSTFNPDFLPLLHPQLVSPVPIDSSTTSMLSDSPIESTAASLQLSSPSISSSFDTEGSSKQKTKPRATRRSKARVRQCDLNREERKFKKPLSCPECNRRFAWQRDLKRHIKSRHPEKARAMELSLEKFTCEFSACKSKSFARDDHLKRHLKNKHGVVRPRRTK